MGDFGIGRARRLDCTKTKVHTSAVRTVELPAEVLVEVGQKVTRGELLVKRFIAPILLLTTLKKLAEIEDFGKTTQLRPEDNDRATLDGEVTRIEHWDLRTGEGMLPDWHRSSSVAASFQQVIRIHIQRSCLWP